jgi:hypothetical protein
MATGWNGDASESFGVFGYDVGIKLHTNRGIFGGINYGNVSFIDESHGFSFTAGYRHIIYKHIYGLGYLGWTPNRAYNQGGWTFLDRHQYLLAGLIIGYEFNPIQIGKRKKS